MSEDKPKDKESPVSLGGQVEQLVSPKVLSLILKKKWFDLIASGRKDVEYRNFTAYWQARIMRDAKFRKFNEVHFRNGYHKNAPFMRVSCKKVVMINPERTKYPPVNGEILEGWQFGILLGHVLELRG